VVERRSLGVAEGFSKEEVSAGNADYHVETRSFRSAVQQATRTRKGDVKTAIRNNGSAIVIQFVSKASDNGVVTPDEDDSHGQ
jgi:hypothetical protein